MCCSSRNLQYYTKINKDDTGDKKKMFKNIEKEFLFF